MKKLSLFLVALAMILTSCKPEAEKPTVVTKSVGEVTETTAKVVGQVTADGGAEVTERGVCWNTEGTPEVIDYRTVDGKGIGTYESDMTNLKDNTTYYARAYATNEKGVSYGEEMTFTTKKEVELPTVTTAEVEDITESEAVSGGEVVSDGGEVTARGICWSTKQNPTIEDNKTTDGTGVGSFTSNLSNLASQTTYYVRAYATNEKGTAYGEEVSFTTEEEPEEPGDEPENPGDEPEEPGDEPEEPGDEPEEPGDEPEEPGDEPEEPGDEPETPIEPEKPVGPVVITAEVTEITLYSAKCGGGVSDGGGAVVVERGVCWNTIGNPTVLDFTTKDGSGLGSYISSITGLEYGTTYYVRAYAANANGVAGYGKEVTFTTLDKLLPTVTTTAEVTDITVSSAICGGEVTFDGNVEVIARGICWNTTGNPTIEDSKTTNGEGIGSYTSNMTNLKHGTIYYVRAYATNEVGTAYGEEVNFTTIDKLLPTVTTTAEVTDITVSSAICGGEVTFDGNVEVIARGICWNTTGNPTIEDSKTTNGEGIGSYTSNMTNLKHGTIYYVRAYATNEVGTAYGEEVNFTTIEKLLPTVTTSAEVTDITYTSAVCGGEVTFEGNVSVIARGICWNTTGNPTIEDSKTTNGSGIGSYTSNMTNLEHNTTYYVRAYATNEAGTAYGEEVTFTTLPIEGTTNGHSWVDLGLPSGKKWATCNVGATSPEGYGDYFAWGETSTKAEYNSDNCPTYGLSISELQSQGYIDSEGNLTAQYDAARANWGGTWRMPTKAEYNELLNNCTWTWTIQNGVKGYKVKGPNGNSIFLPAAGVRIGSSLSYAGSIGYYWSSTPGGNDSCAYYLYFDSDDHDVSCYSRYSGQSVRPVLE